MEIFIIKLITTLGLFLDIIGAWCIAYEVINIYHENPFETTFGGKQIKLEKFQIWEKKKLFFMKIGLLLLTLGFLMQIFSLWALDIINYFK